MQRQGCNCLAQNVTLRLTHIFSFHFNPCLLFLIGPATLRNKKTVQSDLLKLIKVSSP